MQRPSLGNIANHRLYCQSETPPSHSINVYNSLDQASFERLASSSTPRHFYDWFSDIHSILGILAERSSEDSNYRKLCSPSTTFLCAQQFNVILLFLQSWLESTICSAFLCLNESHAMLHILYINQNAFNDVNLKQPWLPWTQLTGLDFHAKDNCREHFRVIVAENWVQDYSYWWCSTYAVMYSLWPTFQNFWNIIYSMKIKNDGAQIFPKLH